MLLVGIRDIKVTWKGVALEGDATDGSLGDVRIVRRYFSGPDGVGIFDEAYRDHDVVLMKHLRVCTDSRILELLYVGESLRALVDVQFMIEKIG